MEIRYQSVDRLKRVARINEEVGLAIAGMKSSALVANRLERSRDRGTHGDNSPPVPARAIECFGRTFRDGKRFRQHLMSLNGFGPYRPESSPSDMQHHKFYFHPVLANFFQKAGREMKPRRWSRHGPFVF